MTILDIGCTGRLICGWFDADDRWNSITLTPESVVWTPPNPSEQADLLAALEALDEALVFKTRWTPDWMVPDPDALNRAFAIARAAIARARGEASSPGVVDVSHE